MKPRLLLHLCCAPCSTYVVRALRASFDVTGCFYNPNIHPEDEYQVRLKAMRDYARQIGLDVVELPYDPDQWFEAIRGHEADPEGGERCVLCYRIRLEPVARLARERGYSYFAATWTVSPYKRASTINAIGRTLGDQEGVTFYEADFKKRDGFKISGQMSREAGLYRQDYCGCIFSRQERNRRKSERTSC